MKMMTDAVARERILDLQAAAQRACRIEQIKSANRRPAGLRYARWRRVHRPCTA